MASENRTAKIDQVIAVCRELGEQESTSQNVLRRLKSKFPKEEWSESTVRQYTSTARKLMCWTAKQGSGLGVATSQALLSVHPTTEHLNAVLAVCRKTELSPARLMEIIEACTEASVGFHSTPLLLRSIRAIRMIRNELPEEGC